jgi:hypothetical protein
MENLSYVKNSFLIEAKSIQKTFFKKSDLSKIEKTNFRFPQTQA